MIQAEAGWLSSLNSVWPTNKDAVSKRNKTQGAEDAAQSLSIQPIQEARDSIPIPHEPSVAVYTYNPSTQEMEAGESVQGHALLHNEFEVILG